MARLVLTDIFNYSRYEAYEYFQNISFVHCIIPNFKNFSVLNDNVCATHQLNLEKKISSKLGNNQKPVHISLDHLSGYYKNYTYWNIASIRKIRNENRLYL